MLEHTNEDHCATLQNIEAAKSWLNFHYDSHVHPHTFKDGNLILVYDQAHVKSGKENFESMWYGPYVIHHSLDKGSYLLIDSKGHLLKNTLNGL